MPTCTRKKWPSTSWAMFSAVSLKSKSYKRFVTLETEAGIVCYKCHIIMNKPSIAEWGGGGTVSM